MATVEELRLEIKAQVSDAVSKLKQYDRTTKDVTASNKTLQSTFASMRDVMQGPIAAFNMGKAAVIAIAGGIDKLIMSSRAADQSLSNLKSVLISTGGASGMTMGAMVDLSEEMHRLTLFSHEQVAQSEAVLLTFRTIGKDVFPTATRAIADMAQVMGMDLQSATVMVGKALNEPIKGIGALRKVGVQLTETQASQIKKYMEVNDIMSAQKVILGELNMEFGGAAVAAANKASGAYANMKKEFGEIGEELGAMLARSADWKKLSNMFSELSGSLAGTNLQNDLIDRIKEIGKLQSSGAYKAMDTSSQDNALMKVKITTEEISKAIESAQNDIKKMDTVAYRLLTPFAQADIKAAKERIALYQSMTPLAEYLGEVDKKRAKAAQELTVAEEALAIAEKNRANESDLLGIVSDNRFKTTQENYDREQKTIENTMAAYEKYEKLKEDSSKDAGVYSLGAMGESNAKLIADATDFYTKLGETAGSASNDARWAKDKEYYDKKLSEEKMVNDKIASMAIDAAKQILDAMVDAESQKNDAYIKGLEKEIDAKKKAGEDTTALEEELAKKKNELAKKEFESRKLNTIAQIAINTAAAVIGFLANPGGEAGVALSIGAGALGLVEAGIAASQQYTPMAKGGIVNRPTRALIGEAGPEAIIPLNRAGGLGTTVNYITYQTVQGNIWAERQLEALAVGANAKASRGW